MSAPSSEMDGFYVACLERKVTVIIKFNLFNSLYFTYSITVRGKGKAFPPIQKWDIWVITIGKCVVHSLQITMLIFVTAYIDNFFKVRPIFY